MIIGARNGAWAKAGGGVPTARDYVQDGLIAMWDGIENAGWGVHDPNATVWKDLSGNGNDATVDRSSFFDDVSINSNSNKNSIAFCDKIVPSYLSGLDCSVEIVFFVENLNGYNNREGLIFWNCAKTVRYNAFRMSSNHIVATNGYGHASDIRDFVGKTNSLSTVYNGNVDTLFMNGILLEREAVQTSWNYDMNRFDIFGRGYNSAYNVFGKCFQCRIYSRQLTSSEIAANYAIDKARFNLP